MLKFLLPLLCKEYEKKGNAYRLVMPDDEVIICTDEEVEARLAATEIGQQYSFEIEFYRFGRRTTVAHVLYRDSVFVGWATCPDPLKFSKKAGQDLALRMAADQFINHENYRLKWHAQELSTQPTTS